MNNAGTDLVRPNPPQRSSEGKETQKKWEETARNVSRAIRALVFFFPGIIQSIKKNNNNQRNEERERKKNNSNKTKNEEKHGRSSFSAFFFFLSVGKRHT